MIVKWLFRGLVHESVSLHDNRTGAPKPARNLSPNFLLC